MERLLEEPQVRDVLVRANQPIAAEIERGVQRQAKLDHAQVRGEMGRPAGDQVAQRLAHFRGKLLELGMRQTCQVTRRFDGAVEAGKCIDGHG